MLWDRDLLSGINNKQHFIFYLFFYLIIFAVHLCYIWRFTKTIFVKLTRLKSSEWRGTLAIRFSYRPIGRSIWSSRFTAIELGSTAFSCLAPSKLIKANAFPNTTQCVSASRQTRIAAMLRWRREAAMQNGKRWWEQNRFYTSGVNGHSQWFPPHTAHTLFEASCFHSNKHDYL